MRHFGGLPFFLKPVNYCPANCKLLSYMEGHKSKVSRRSSRRGSPKTCKPRRRSSASQDPNNMSQVSSTKPELLADESPSETGLCGVCRGPVADSHDAVQCDGPCGKWVHAVCGGITPQQYGRMQREAEGEWKCGECKGGVKNFRSSPRSSPRVNARSSPKLERQQAEVKARNSPLMGETAKGSPGVEGKSEIRGKKPLYCPTVEQISSDSNSDDEQDCSPSLTSPPRTPLGVLNGPERAQARDRAESRTPRTPQEERNSRKVSKRNHRGETALHCAAIKGNTALVRKLLRLGADPNTQDNAGWTPLHEACNRGNVAVARLLIQHEADIDYPGLAKETPLHDAARNGHVKVVRLLVKSGASTLALNAEKKTPLQVAENKENPCTNPTLQGTIQFLKGENVDESSGGEESDGDLGSLLIDESQETGVATPITKATPTTGTATPTIKATPTVGTASALSTQGKAATGSGTKGSSKAKLTYGNPATRADMSTGEEVSSSGQTKEEDPYEFKTSSKEPTPASSRGSASPAVAGKEYEAGDKRGAEEEADEEGRRKKRKEDGGPSNGGRGRGVRGNSTEKTVGKPGGRGRGSAGADRKSPNSVGGMAGKGEVNASPAPSPGKGRGQAAGGQESDSDGDKREGGPKVPPLKIVINSGNSSRGRDEREGGDGKKTSYIVNNTGSEEGESSEGKGNEGESSEGGDKASSGGRFTRSRANAPGEEGEGEMSGAPSEAAPSTSADGARKGAALTEREDYLHKKRKLRGNTGENCTVNSNVSEFRNAVDGQPLTDIEKHLNIRKQIEQRRKNLFPVQPKPPQGFKDYLMNKKTYHLQGNMGIDSRIQPIPKIAPPPSLEGPLRELFLSQENERYKLRMKHLVEKEKLVLAVEQEILRVHGRAARALANQSLPYSVCTILRDEEVYTPIDPHQEENNRDIRSRYNGRLFLSWLQDVDDKWEKIKEQMVLRHHNEAESLNAVQKMDWEWKLQAINRDVLITKMKPTTDDLHVPMVQVNEDFDQLLS